MYLLTYLLTYSLLDRLRLAAVTLVFNKLFHRCLHESLLMSVDRLMLPPGVVQEKYSACSYGMMLMF